MLTIGQLAAHVGVTVKAVRHYHRIGLLPEPDRDDAGYRRYGAAAVIDLTRIKVLRDAGIPLHDIPTLLRCDAETLAAAVEQIERDLDDRIDVLKSRKAQVAQLTAGESLYLSPEVVALLDHLRGLGVPDAVLELERDGWIIWSAASPDEVAGWATLKLRNLADPHIREDYLLCARAASWDADDPRLIEVAARLVQRIEVGEIDQRRLAAENPTTVALLVDRFADTPGLARLNELVYEHFRARAEAEASHGQNPW